MMEQTDCRMQETPPVSEEILPIPARGHRTGAIALSVLLHVLAAALVIFLGSVRPINGEGDGDIVVVALVQGPSGSGAMGGQSGETSRPGHEEQVGGVSSARNVPEAATPVTQASLPHEPSPSAEQAETVAKKLPAKSLPVKRIAHPAEEAPDVATARHTKREQNKKENTAAREKAKATQASQTPDHAEPRATDADSKQAATSGMGMPQGSGSASAAGQGREAGNASEGRAGGAGADGGSGGQAGGSGDSGDSARYLKGNYEYIKKRVRQFLVYSPQAKRMGIQGMVSVAFTIKKDGHVENVVVRRSSGFETLDESAVEAVQNAAPFKAPPESARVVMPIQFSLR